MTDARDNGLGFTMIHRVISRDDHFLHLGDDARLLFLWLMIDADSAVCGLYSISEKRMAKAFRDGSTERVTKALDELAAVKPAGYREPKSMVLYDPDNEVVWVVNRATYANRSPKMAVKMQKEVAACPPSPLVEQFVRAHGRMLSLRTKGSE